MNNLAGHDPVDVSIRVALELQTAGIRIVERDMMGHPEVKTKVGGQLHAWEFFRNWTYWVAYTDVNVVPLELAAEFNETIGHACKVRVDGHCASPAPKNDVRVYHIDTIVGLESFAIFLEEKMRWDRIPSNDADPKLVRSMLDEGWYVVKDKARAVAKWSHGLTPQEAIREQIDEWEESSHTILTGDYLTPLALGDLWLSKAPCQRLSVATFKLFTQEGGNTFEKAEYGPAVKYKEADNGC